MPAVLSRPRRISPRIHETWTDVVLPPRDVPIDDWAESAVVLPRAVAAEPGPLNLSRTPYLREILRAATDPDVEEITLQCSTQVGKTMACLLVLLHCLDEDPWPCLHVAPREDDAVAVNVDRYQKIIHESPRLRRHLTGAANDMTREAIRLNGASIHFVGAQSAAALASRAVAYLVLDETDKYPPYTGKEADPIALARERTRTFWNRKILKVSTPTTERGYIHQEFLAGDRRRFYIPCPTCGHYQRLVMGTRDPGSPGIHWPAEERDPERILDLRLAWYECESCRGRISDLAKVAALRLGVWAPEAQTVNAQGELEGPAPPRRRLSYHLSALYSPWLTWSAIAAEFLRSKDYPSLLMNFRNSWEAEVWQDRVDELRGDFLRRRVADYPIGRPPAGAKVLTAGVDVQLDHCWYVIRAWGDLGESWLVRSGRVESFDALHAVLFRCVYLTPSQDVVPLRMAFVDSGYRTDEVYSFCKWTGCQAVKGDSRVLRGFTVSKVVHADGTVSPLVLLDTALYKAKLHRFVRIRDGEPGAWHLPQGMDEEYYIHMTAEQRVRVQDRRTGQISYRWRVIHEGAPNHLFDAEVYCLAAAETLNLEYQFLKTPMAGSEVTTNVQPTPEKQAPRGPRGIVGPPKRRITRLRSDFFSRRGR